MASFRGDPFSEKKQNNCESFLPKNVYIHINYKLTASHRRRSDRVADLPGTAIQETSHDKTYCRKSQLVRTFNTIVVFPIFFLLHVLCFHR